MPISLSEQECSNCKFSRRPTGQADAMLSCRFLPPTPCDNNNWRVVPEKFWCGKWEWGPKEPIGGRVGARPAAG